MKFKIVCALAIILLSAYSIQAQQIDLRNDVVRWEVDKLFDLSYDTAMSYHASFVLHGRSKIEWIQDNGNHVIEFQIREVDGNWINPASDGDLIFGVKTGDRTGVIRFSRQLGNISISTELEENGKNIVPFVFNVNAVSKL